jgi:hypothetical protein
MHWAAAWPKAPALFWPVQKMPVALVLETVPVVSGVRSTPRGAWNPARLGRQSVVVSGAPVGVQDAPESALRPPVFVFQVESHVPEMHFGHGEAEFPEM